MDYTILTTAGTSSGLIMIIYFFYKIFKHSKCRSKCCKHEVEINVDLESPNTSSRLNGIASESDSQ